MTSPRILLVDDEHQVSRMLRTSLELSRQNYTVIDVPSGEEALLELARGPVDLLVADIRLPGISGLELLEKVRQLNPKARAIIVTGHPTEEAREKADSLGVIAFLTKPIRTSYFLEAVHRALETKGETVPQVLESEKAFMAEWLLAMQRELVAEATFLLDDKGQVVVQAGELSNIDLKAALPSLMTAFSAGLKVSNLLDRPMPENFQYFDGSPYDFYLASVGPYYALVIAFRDQQEPGKIAAVLQYSRRAASDLLNALYNVQERPSPSQSAPPEILEMRPKPPISKPQTPSTSSSPPEEQIASDIELDKPPMTKEEAGQFWDTAIQEAVTKDDRSGDVMTYEEARKQGLLKGADPDEDQA